MAKNAIYDLYNNIFFNGIFCHPCYYTFPPPLILIYSFVKM